MPTGIYPREKRATGERHFRYKHGKYVLESRSEKSKEQKRVHSRLTYRANREQKLARQKEYRLKNQDRIRARAREYGLSPAGQAARARAQERRRTPEGRAKRHEEWLKWGEANPQGKRARWLKASYGLSLAQYDTMLQQQGGICKICGNPPTGRGVGRILEVDHCHKTERVRGLICRRCNTAVAYVELEPSLLQKIVEYLGIDHVKVEVT